MRGAVFVAQLSAKNFQTHPGASRNAASRHPSASWAHFDLIHQQQRQNGFQLALE
jgi:hypothetical protein